MQFEIVVTGHTAWWLTLINWLGANMKWTHALLKYSLGEGHRIIEACEIGVVDRPWKPKGYESYARFRLKDSCFASEEDRHITESQMLAFAFGEVDKRYRYEALPAIALRILRKLFGKRGARARLLDNIIGKGEVCTSLVDRSLLFGGFDLVPDVKIPFVLPDEIAASEDLELIEEVR